MKYIKIINDLLKVKLYHKDRKKTAKSADNNEYWTFLRTLFDEVQKSNKILALKLGFDLFPSYSCWNVQISLIATEQLLAGIFAKKLDQWKKEGK